MISGLNYYLEFVITEYPANHLVKRSLATLLIPSF